LATATAVEDAALGWRSECDGHFQGADRPLSADFALQDRLPGN